MSIAVTQHVRLDASGIAWIDDTNIKVIEVVLDKIAHGNSPEEMHFQHPHLTLGQIYAALSYYHDHQGELDAAIQKQLEEVEALAVKAKDSPVRKRLREAGKLP
ncbi:MAG: DUF433 domain-containing protein [Planctomycetes bacterium]|nr:DUF433 domain-containing protein [Planctomycetota bacterium]